MTSDKPTPEDFANHECEGCHGGDLWPTCENPWRCPVCDAEFWIEESDDNDQ